MQKLFTSRVVVILFSCLVVGSLTGLYLLDKSILSPKELSFRNDSGEKIVCNYYEGTLPGGILILHGFSSDQTAMRNIVSEFKAMGLYILTMDFSGHGRSEGGLAFNNAQTDKLAKEVLQAKILFKNMSGLPDNRLIFFGHSMGARVAIQAETMDNSPVKGVLVLGVQINIAVNTQASFFTGVQDNDLTWVQSLNATNPSTNIAIYLGAWDDIIPPSSAELLLQRLQLGGNGQYSRNLTIVPYVFHNYEIYSNTIISQAKSWVLSQFGFSDSLITKSLTQIRNGLWILFIFSIYFTLIFGASILKEPKYSTHMDEDSMKITNSQRFLKFKLLQWIYAIPIILVLCMLFFIIPLGIPVFNLLYVGAIGGNGITSILLYRKKKMKNVEGNWHFNLKNEFKAVHGIQSITFISLIVIASTLFSNSGINYVIALNSRIFWIFIFCIFSALGFYVGQFENRMVQSSSQKHGMLILNLISLTPFFLGAILFGAIGSLSGMLGALQGLLILGITILSGNILKKICNSNILVALFQGFLLQLLVMPQGALFMIF